MLIERDTEIRDPDIIRFLEDHLADMRAISPPESVHALDLVALRHPSIQFWVARDTDCAVMGCGALKTHSATLGEIKSMRTSSAHRRQGVAAALLKHVLQTAHESGLTVLKLETGSTDFFAPARNLYAAHGFVPCGPFADYTDDPHSAYMQKVL